MNLSTKDMTYSPSKIPTMHFEPPKEEILSTRTNQLNLCCPQRVLYSEVPLYIHVHMLSPKCPLSRGATVHICAYILTSLVTQVLCLPCAAEATSTGIDARESSSAEPAGTDRDQEPSSQGRPGGQG